MKMVSKLLAYETPQVEVIEVEGEKGFANSDGDDDGFGGGTTPGTPIG